MEYQHLIVDEKKGVMTVTLNRPKALNALNKALIAELADLFDGIHKQTNVRCVILTGSGDKAFVAGADISELAHFDTIQGGAFGEAGQSMMDKIAALPVPVIAAVNGFALGGGCELSLACDFIHAADSASFGLPEETLGLIPGFGGTQRLSRRIGLARAMEMVFTAKRISAEEARNIGLVNQVVPAAELMESVQKVAARIASMGPTSIALAKRAMVKGSEVDLGAGCHMEREAFALSFATPEAKEGTAAFLEKRKAVFPQDRPV